MSVPTTNISRQFDDVRANSVILTHTAPVGEGELRGQPSRNLVSIEAIIGSPENNSVGSVGDLRVQFDGTGGVWQKISGNRTKTGWSRLSSTGTVAISYGNPVSISANTNAAGSSATASRSDHTHALTTNTPSSGHVPTWNGSAWVAGPVTASITPGTTATSITPDANVAAGSSTNYARQDHVHGMVTDTAVSISSNNNAEGISASFARADHTHRLTTAVPTNGQIPVWNGSAWVATAQAQAGNTASTITPDAVVVAGTSTSYARQDHVHAISCATGVSIQANTNAEGSSTSFARADHRHALTPNTPSNGQIPRWNGSAWVASNVHTAGSGSAGVIDLGGLRIQNGVVAAGGDGTLTLPAPFANANYSIVASIEGAEATNIVEVMFENHTTTNVTYRKRSKANGTTDVTAATQGFRWIAVGQAP